MYIFTIQLSRDIQIGKRNQSILDQHKSTISPADFTTSIDGEQA